MIGLKLVWVWLLLLIALMIGGGEIHEESTHILETNSTRSDLHKFIEKLEAGLKACQHVKKTIEDHYDIQRHPELFNDLIMPVTSKDVFSAKHFSKILNSNSKFVYAFQGTSVLKIYKFIGIRMLKFI